MKLRIRLTIGPVVAAMTLTALACSPKPAKLEILPENIVLEGSEMTKQLEAKVSDADGNVIKEGVEIVWFSDDTSLIKLSQTGEVTGLASGEADIEVEVVGTDLKLTVPVRVKIPQSIQVSHEKLRLWTGQVKDNVWAEVHSEKDAFIEGYLPKWSSDDPTVVKVEQIEDPGRRQSWVKLTGLKSGTTFINAQFQHITKSIRVAVFDEDEEVAMDGTRIPKKKEGEEEDTDETKKEKGKKSGKKKK